MDLALGFHQILNSYLGSRPTNLSGHPAYQIIIKDIPNELKTIAGHDFSSKGSVGQGYFTDVPWIAIYDNKITTGSGKGFYLVYLFKPDMSGFYLTANMSSDEWEAIYKDTPKKERTASMRRFAAFFGSKFKDLPDGFSDKKIDLNGKKQGYVDGCAIAKYYPSDGSWTDKSLRNDVAVMIEQYRSFVDDLDGCSHLDLYKKVLESDDCKANESEESENDMPAKKKEKVIPKNIILFGPPGTGKTYQTVNYAVAICDKKSLASIEEQSKSDRKTVTDRFRDLIAYNQVNFVTFHQSYSYEDFVIGLFPKLVGEGQDAKLTYEPRDGIFRFLCKEASLEENKDKNYVLVIDEINRGNISKIFGELITLIEESKRTGEPECIPVSLPTLLGNGEHGTEKFSVPPNLYIIGTMNTADRSIQHVDTALRRRFRFVEITPDPSLLAGITITSGGVTVKIDDLLTVLNRNIKRYFDREHSIGHSYFMPLVNASLGEDEKLDILADLFRESIIPLLQDYFFEDYQKIRKVLGEEEADNAHCLVKLIGTAGLDDDSRDVYEIGDEDAFRDIEAYRMILETLVD